MVNKLGLAVSILFLRACLVAVFENCSGKQILRTVFGVFFEKNCVWELNFEKQFLFSKKKKKHVWLS